MSGVKLEHYAGVDCTLFRHPVAGTDQLQQRIDHALVGAWTEGQSPQKAIDAVLGDPRARQLLTQQLESSVRFRREAMLASLEQEQEGIQQQLRRRRDRALARVEAAFQELQQRAPAARPEPIQQLQQQARAKLRQLDQEDDLEALLPPEPDGSPGRNPGPQHEIPTEAAIPVDPVQPMVDAGVVVPGPTTPPEDPANPAPSAPRAETGGRSPQQAATGLARARRRSAPTNNRVTARRARRGARARGHADQAAPGGLNGTARPGQAEAPPQSEPTGRWYERGRFFWWWQRSPLRQRIYGVLFHELW